MIEANENIIYPQIESFTFKSSDGLDIHGYISLPEGNSFSPCLVALPAGIHGGFKDKYIATKYDQLHLNLMSLMAGIGVATLVIDRRGSHGYGDYFAMKMEFGGLEIDDVGLGILEAVKRFRIDSARVIGVGASRSALTILSTAMKYPAIFKGLILNSGVYDILTQLHFEYRTRSDLWPTHEVIGNDKVKSFPYYERSPIFHVSKKPLNCSIVITHGEDDPYVLYSQSLSLYESIKLTTSNVTFKLFDRLPHTKEGGDPFHPEGQILWDYLLPYIKSLM